MRPESNPTKIFDGSAGLTLMIIIEPGWAVERGSINLFHGIE
uniref:Uncharacterized protein n=1 Tax=Lepeophtheirus salmonis TaxID=72036 RepID=A0A0K2UX42_LEPSM